MKSSLNKAASRELVRGKLVQHFELFPAAIPADSHRGMFHGNAHAMDRQSGTTGSVTV